MDVVALGTNPISPESPAGKDARFAADYEALQAEVDKLSMISAEGESIDWKRVQQLGENILSQQSKHILVAAYTAAALLETEGLPGLADGATLLRDLTANFWDTMYPSKKRLRGRFNAYSWWKERASNFLKNYQPDGPQPPEVVDRLKQAVKDLDDALAETSDDAPMLRDVLEQVGRIPVAEPEPEQPADQPAGQTASQAASQAGGQAPKQTPAPSAAAPAVPADVSSMEEQQAQTLFKQGLEVVSSYGQWMAGQNPRDPLVYRISRWAAWSIIAAPPPAEGAATRLPPPDAQIMQAIEQLLSQANYQAALKSSEEHVSEYLFWLDLSFASARALQGMGDDWAAANAAVEYETALFVKRLPGIANLTFSDGTPFCSDQTREWLDSLGSHAGGEGQKADAVDAALAQARKTAAGKDLVGALAQLDKATQGAGRVRDRFRLQVGVLSLLPPSPSPDLAMACIDDVLAVIDRHELARWEPELALEGLVAAFGALKASEAPEVKEKAQAVYARLGRISPAQALRTAPPPSE